MIRFSATGLVEKVGSTRRGEIARRDTLCSGVDATEGSEQRTNEERTGGKKEGRKEGKEKGRKEEKKKRGKSRAANEDGGLL